MLRSLTISGRHIIKNRQMKNFVASTGNKTRRLISTGGINSQKMAFEADGYVRYPGKTGGFENPIYDAEFKRSCDDYEGFWEEQAKEVVWMKKPKTVIDMSHPHLHRWFPDGVMNICYNTIDRHVDNGRGDVQALLYESAYTGVSQQFTFREL